MNMGWGALIRDLRARSAQQKEQTGVIDAMSLTAADALEGQTPPLSDVGEAWTAYYRAGMSSKEARAFKAGWAAAVRASTPERIDAEFAASCHLCVGAGGHEEFDGEWAECSCQRGGKVE